MNAYFEKFESSQYVINNFYLFFVVNNESINKCANQIKLVSDSKDFINSIKNYVKPFEKEE